MLIDTSKKDDKLQLKSFEDAMGLIDYAIKERKTAGTTKNATSSRSHLIISFKFLLGEKQAGSATFVDLAGSEKPDTKKP